MAENSIVTGMRHATGGGGMLRGLSVAKIAYRALVPEAVRNFRMANRLKGMFLSHQTIYDADYFAELVDGEATASSEVMSRSIAVDMAPKRVVDVGCGTGAMLAALRDRGCDVFGLEYADAAIVYCRRRGVEVRKFDIENDHFETKADFDVAISMEVAEHLPKRVADRYVDLLTGLSSVVVFTAATPGQGGTDHVNEQPRAYWIEKFGRRGFLMDEDTSMRWRSAWTDAGSVSAWYCANLMIFRRTRAA